MRAEPDTRNIRPTDDGDQLEENRCSGAGKSRLRQRYRPAISRGIAFRDNSAERLAYISTNLNLITKVLDFVQFGEPKGTVGSTMFELVVPCKSSEFIHFPLIADALR